MPPPNQENSLNHLSHASRRGFFKQVGTVGLVAAAAVAEIASTADTLTTIDTVATQLFVERENIPPWITQHSDATDTLGFYVSFSGTGLPVAGYMGNLIGADVSKHGLSALAVNDGSHINIEGVAEELIRRARGLRPDMEKLKFVFHGLSFGGIEAQLVANYLTEHHSDNVEVVGIMYESTPSGPEAVKKPLGQFLVRSHRPVGKVMLYASNMWGIFVEQGRRDDSAWYDMMKCSGDTFASVIPDQAKLIDNRFPAPIAHEKSIKHYIGSFDESDLYVDTVLAYTEMNKILGGGLGRLSLAGAGHAGGWVAQQYGVYRSAYEIALTDIMKQITA